MLRTVQGDVLEIAITLCDIELELVKKVVFESKDLTIHQEAVEEDGVYRIRIEGEQTKDFNPGFAHYQIIITLADDQELTVKRSKMEVLRKISADD